MKCYVIGNGPSLTPSLLESLDASCGTFAVNRIWKMFEWTRWRPQFYVRAELPAYDREHVQEDLHQMAQVGCVMYLHKGFQTLEDRNPHHKTRYEFFTTCDGKECHDWHLPTICGYGTVVHVAMQIACQMFDEIELVGCDLGTEHFYPGETFTNEALAREAHAIAARCCPVPIHWKEKEHAN